MRLSHLIFILSALFSFSCHATLDAKKSQLHDLPLPILPYNDLTWPILGHWKTSDEACTEVCEFVITHVTNSMAKMVTFGDRYAEGYLVLRHVRGTLWRAEYKTTTRVFYFEEHNGFLRNENDTLWRRIKK